VLQGHGVTIEQMVDARKEALAGDDAWTLLAGAEQVLVAKGKAYQVFNPRTDSKEALLAQALGRTGNLRAPTLRIGEQLWVGFSEGLYARLAGLV
jgi:hypothetical protein